MKIPHLFGTQEYVQRQEVGRLWMMQNRKRKNVVLQYKSRIRRGSLIDNFKNLRRNEWDMDSKFDIISVKETFRSDCKFF